MQVNFISDRDSATIIHQEVRILLYLLGLPLSPTPLLPYFPTSLLPYSLVPLVSPTSLPCREWDGNGKSCSNADFALYGNLTAVSIYRLFDNSQSQSSSCNFACISGAMKWLE